MIIIDNERVLRCYEGMCEKPWTKKQIHNMLTYRKRIGMKEEWLILKCAYNMWIANHDFDKEPK